MTSSALSNILDPGSWYSDAAILHIRTNAFNEAAKYVENALAQKEKEITSLQSQLELAESLIPTTSHHLYDLLKKPESYGGSE